MVQRNLPLVNYPQGTKSFERWSKEINNAAILVNYDNYDWKQAAVDAIPLQTLNRKLRQRVLQDDVSYEDLLKLGIPKEQGAALLEKAIGQSSSHEQHDAQEVRRLQYENRKLKACLPKTHAAAVVSTNVNNGKSALQWGRNVQNAKR